MKSISDRTSAPLGLVVAFVAVALMLLPSATAVAATQKTPTLAAPWHTATSIHLAFYVSDIEGLDSFFITDGSQTWEQSALDPWNRTLTLPTNNTYTFIVRTRDTAGRLSQPSNPVSVLIEDQPPSAPTNLRVENGMLVWDPAIDNSGAISGYQVLYDGSSPYQGAQETTVPLQQWYDPMQDTYSPTRGSHTFTVTAYDPSGNGSAPSNAVTAIVP
jgi:hypothetical protein